MKAISLWQPWASAIALGLKRVETRSWPTKHRGPIAIHAAKSKVGVQRAADEAVLIEVAQALGIAKPSLWTARRRLESLLPFGAIVAVAELVECDQSTPDLVAHARSFRLGELELLMGDWTAGRWLWRLDNIRAVDPPVPTIGRQGLFEVPEVLPR